MTNLESESAEPTPAAPADDDPTVVPAPEVETPAEVTAEAEPGTPKKTTGLIVGAAGGVIVAIIAAVLITLAITKSGFFSSNSNTGDPAATVKAYFAARTCNALQAQMAPADWSQAMATSSCQDSQVATAMGSYKVTVKAITIDGDIANVDVSVASATSTAAPQTATINLIQVKGQWKVDHVIAKAA